MAEYTGFVNFERLSYYHQKIKNYIDAKATDGTAVLNTLQEAVEDLQETVASLQNTVADLQTEVDNLSATVSGGN